MVDLAVGPNRPTFTMTSKRVLSGFAAMLCVGAVPASEDKPMLWDTNVVLVSENYKDGRPKGKWSNPGPKKLCLRTFRPKVGAIDKDGADCRYTRVSRRGIKIFRKVICVGYPSGSFETVVRGTETDDAYNTRLVTTLRDDNGKLVSVVEVLETGQRIGECPEGMPVER